MQMRKTCRSLLTLLLAATLLLGAAPLACAEDGKQDLDRLMESFDERVQAPKESSLLDEPAEMIVVSEHGNYIYALSKPGGGAKLFEIEEAARVLVYAKQSGYALGVLKGTTIGGWMSEKLLERADISMEDSPKLKMAFVMSHFNSSVQKPKATDLLDEPERMKVESQHGNFIYARTRPVNGTEIYTIPEASIVIVYARQSGCALAVLEDGSAGGWMKEKLLVPENDEASGNGIEREKRIEELMQSFNSSVQAPKKASLLDEPVKMKVSAKYGNVVYVMAKLGTGRLCDAPDGTIVNVYARQKGFALALAEDASIGGWISEKLLAPAEG